MGTFIGLLLVFGFIIFTAYEIIGIIRYFRDKKKNKIQNKEDKE